MHSADAMEVQFVAGSDRTLALLALSASDLRHVGDQDDIAVHMRAVG
jgi:hypothetical protein